MSYSGLEVSPDHKGEGEKALTAGYREDIDWLRAIAVLSVIGFHFEAPRIFGGFVGVDIFFVISGYLITGIITAELREGAFCFARFYERRIRRLLPALYLMIACVAIPCMHDLLASERTEFFRSAIAAVTFVSNVFFFLQSGYFDHAAAEKPLLHTWSLAVEEQFYLALPLLLWSLLHLSRGRRAALPIALAIMAGLSLALSIWLIATGRSANAFFMSPPRAWEFLIGGALALPRVPVLKNRRLQQTLRGSGVALILAAVFGYQQGPNFPGYRALLPCVGAALFIWSGTGVETRVRHPLSLSGILRFCGQISYSLYLWHWPLFTLARFSKASLVLDILDKTVLFLLLIAISYLSWRFVERPFRERRLAQTRRSAFGHALAASLLLLAACAGGLALSSTGSESDRVAARLDAFNGYDYTALYQYHSCFTPADGRFPEACWHFAPDKTNVLLWGDSLSAHYLEGLRVRTDPQRVNIMQTSWAACRPTLNAAQGVAACSLFAGEMKGFFAEHKPDLVIMSADWLEYARPPRFDDMIADIRTTLAQLDAWKIQVALLGPAVQFRTRLPSLLARGHLRGVEVRSDEVLLPDAFALDRMMRQALPSTDRFTYISVLEAVCPVRQCPLTLAGGIPLSFDHAHLTAEGSAYVMGRVVPLLGLK